MSAVGAYRAALRLYPSTFRVDFGDDMVALLEQQLRDEGRLRVWARVGVDLVITIPSIHVEAHMKRDSGPVLIIIVAALAVLAGVVGGPMGLAAGAALAAVAVAVRVRTRPIGGRTSWWKPASAGAGLLVALVVVTTATGELPENGWFLAMAVLFAALGLLATGLVLAIASLTTRGRQA